MATFYRIVATDPPTLDDFRSYVDLGTPHVAELVIPADAQIAAERTGKLRGHHTLWGEPAAILACVAAVHPAVAVD